MGTKLSVAKLSLTRVYASLFIVAAVSLTVVVGVAAAVDVAVSVVVWLIVRQPTCRNAGLLVSRLAVFLSALHPPTLIAACLYRHIYIAYFV